MKIAIKGIFHERTEDAPFVGALISAIDCNINCDGCFNQYLKKMPTIYMTEDEIINEVLTNKFNKGIILAGLEWSLQPEEMLLIIDKAMENNLEVIVYTGLYIKTLYKKIPEIKKKPIYVKHGKYNHNLKGDVFCHGVKLPSTNQNIVKINPYKRKYEI